MTKVRSHRVTKVPTLPRAGRWVGSRLVNDRLVWIDCEMTGLDYVKDALVEVAALVTDSELNVLGDGVDIVIKPPAETLETMPEVVREMHTASGLLAELPGGTTLAARGWTRDGGDLWQVLDRLEDAGCSRYVLTDVTKDGTLQGPNIDLLREVAVRTDKPVVASGGISSLDDIAALRELVPLGVEGAIVGKALYAGAFTLAEALDVAGH